MYSANACTNVTYIIWYIFTSRTAQYHARTVPGHKRQYEDNALIGATPRITEGEARKVYRSCKYTVTVFVARELTFASNQPFEQGLREN